MQCTVEPRSRHGCPYNCGGTRVACETGYKRGGTAQPTRLRQASARQARLPLQLWWHARHGTSPFNWRTCRVQGVFTTVVARVSRAAVLFRLGVSFLFFVTEVSSPTVLPPSKPAADSICQSVHLLSEHRDAWSG